MTGMAVQDALARLMKPRSVAVVVPSYTLLSAVALLIVTERGFTVSWPTFEYVTEKPVFTVPPLALIAYGPPLTVAVAAAPVELTVGSVEKTSDTLGAVNAPLASDGRLTDSWFDRSMVLP